MTGEPSLGGLIVHTWSDSGTATGDCRYRTADGRIGTKELGRALPAGVMTQEQLREKMRREALR